MALFGFGKKKESSILNIEDIKVGLETVDKVEAIKMAGELLLKRGCVDEGYIDAMIARENIVSTYMGEGLAIPHGTSEAKKFIKKTGISVLQFKDGVDFGDEKAYLVVGIAGANDEHLPVLAAISEFAMDEELFNKIKFSNDKHFLYECFVNLKVDL